MNFSTLARWRSRLEGNNSISGRLSSSAREQPVSVREASALLDGTHAVGEDVPQSGASWRFHPLPNRQSHLVFLSYVNIFGDRKHRWQ